MNANRRWLLPVSLLAVAGLASAQTDHSITFRVRPWTDLKLESRVGGYVEGVSVAVGDVVIQGQELVRISAQELTAELASADAVVERAMQRVRYLEIEKAIADREVSIERRAIKIAVEGLPEAKALCEATEREFERAEKLHEKNMVSRQELFKIEARLAEARIRVTTLGEQVKQTEDRVDIAKLSLEAKTVLIEEARARVGEVRALRDLARLRLESTRLLCPLPRATVASISAHPGLLVKAGTHSLVQLIDASRVRLEVWIPAELVNQTHNLEVEVEGPGGETQRLPLSEISGVVSKTNSMKAAVHLENTDGAWVPGALVKGRLVTKQKRD